MLLPIPEERTLSDVRADEVVDDKKQAESNTLATRSKDGPTEKHRIDSEQHQGRRVRFSPSVLVREHAIEIGDFQLCIPTVFREEAFCRARVPVQVSNEMLSSYTSPLLYQASKMALPLTTQQQENRLMGMGLSKQFVRGCIERFWKKQEKVDPVKEDSEDEEVEVSFSTIGRQDTISGAKIPQMFVGGLKDRLQEASWLDECKAKAGAQWYAFCRKHFRAHNAQINAILRARALRKELYEVDDVYRTIRKELNASAEPTIATGSRKRCFDTASGSWFDPID